MGGEGDGGVVLGGEGDGGGGGGRVMAVVVGQGSR